MSFRYKGRLMSRALRSRASFSASVEYRQSKLAEMGLSKSPMAVGERFCRDCSVRSLAGDFEFSESNKSPFSFAFRRSLGSKTLELFFFGRDVGLFLCDTPFSTTFSTAFWSPSLPKLPSVLSHTYTSPLLRAFSASPCESVLGLACLGSKGLNRQPMTTPLSVIPEMIHVAPFQLYTVNSFSHRGAKTKAPIPEPHTATPVAKARRFSK